MRPVTAPQPPTPEPYRADVAFDVVKKFVAAYEAFQRELAGP